ncbi:DUF4190 domain-containing protein [Paramicrobacterium fandaimingii]|uniref:DUF4190 domain-containing protein n=1 Tax=Paramicrobacterium fandaimingii TaxID=2708079 RepID=UPI001420DB57|nr:DUF4190 domain-containing protein [Microbacterium fandaimingii]
MSQTPPPPAPNPYQGAPAPQDKWNVLSIVSFVGSLIGFSIIAAVLGFVSLSQIKKTGEKGRGLALAAVIIGLIAVVIQIIVIIVAITAIGAASTIEYSTY